MPTHIPIVFSTDNNYVMPTGVAILSLLESSNPTTVYDIFVLINDDVTEESRNLLRNQVAYFPNHTIDFISVGNVFENAFEIREISIATYSRLLIPWLLPQYDKVIYADVDMIFRIDLTDIYNIDLKSTYYAGSLDMTFWINESYKNNARKLNLIPEEYINAGFLIFNSILQRMEGLKSLILEYARKKYVFQDQDIINIIAKNKKTFLSPAYNLSPAFFNMINSENILLQRIFESSGLIFTNQNISESIEDCIHRENCILHYNGKKPWNAFTQAWREWWNTYQRSIFYDPDREIEISRSILRPKPSWRSIASQIKRKLLH